MNGKEVISSLKKKLKVSSDRALAKCLGVSIQSILNWNKRKVITALQVATLISKSCKCAAKSATDGVIRPLVEFFPITKCDSKQKARHELFQVTSEDGVTHPYLAGLRCELEEHHGVYVFFDSRGQAIYVGKARKQNLWREMTNAFNRDRAAVQKIKRVRHPNRKQQYRTSNEKTRQIDEYAVPLHEIALYFSAYEVTDAMIGELEALLVRSFANDILNIRMERFVRQRDVRKKP